MRLRTPGLKGPRVMRPRIRTSVGVGQSCAVQVGLVLAALVVAVWWLA